MATETARELVDPLREVDLTPHDNGLPGGEYPRTPCGCGYDVIYTPDGWQHDAAPYLWGDDHDPSVDAADEAMAERWQAAYDAQNEAVTATETAQSQVARHTVEYDGPDSDHCRICGRATTKDATGAHVHDPKDQR